MNWNLHRPSQVVQLLKAHEISTSRRLGQNFLVDSHVLSRIMEAAELSGEDWAIEIGAGLGLLTSALASQAGQVVAIEKDRRCCAALRQTTAGQQNIRLMEADVLGLDLSSLAPPGVRAKIVANLPYSISKPVLQRLFEARRSFERAVVMLQKEVADRLVAAPGTKAYGPLAIATHVFAEAKTVMIVSPNSFLPPPKVRSAIVAIKFLTAPRVDIGDESWFFAVVNAALNQRRKTIVNALASSLPGHDRDSVQAALDTAGLDGRRRGETLSPVEFARLAAALACVA